MKKLILTCILTICLIVSQAICLTVYADDTPETINTFSAETTTTSQVDVVRDMINALPEKPAISKMGYSDKYKTYVDMQAAENAYNQLSQEEKDSLVVLHQRIDNVQSYFNINPLPNPDVEEVSYGFLMDQTLVTSKNRSGKGWSYDPKTQTLTIGDENELDVIFNNIPQNTNNHWKKSYKTVDGTEREHLYAAVLQPVVLAMDNDKNTPTFSPDRPSKLKIVVKRSAVFGNTEWSGKNSQYSSDCTKYFEMGGIFWDGDLEITGNGVFALYSTTYAIYVDGTLNVHDTDLQVRAYNNAVNCGVLNITNATVDAKSYSLSAQYCDVRYKDNNGKNKIFYDSKETIYCEDAGTIKDSTVTVDATWKRNSPHDDIDEYYRVAALSAEKPLLVYNSFISATAHIDKDWPRLKKTAQICGIAVSLQLHDDAFVVSETYADPIFSYNVDFLSNVDFYGLLGKSYYGYGNAVLICSTESRGKAFFSDSGYPIQVGEGVQYTISRPENFDGDSRFIVEYRKDDTLYLRDEDGKKQASWKMDFSDCFELESNVLNEADFTSQVDGRPCNVRVDSGEFTFNALPNSSADRFFETLGGSLTVKLDSDKNYGDVHVFTAPNSTATLQGKGTIENLIVKPNVSITRNNYYVETGSLTIDVATVKNCEIDRIYEDNVSFEGGNVKVDISDADYYFNYFQKHYNTIIYDFNSISEEDVVDLINARMSQNSNYSSNGAQLIDGKFYFYAKKTEGAKDFIENAYVKPSEGYSFYVLPENPDTSADGITTYTFRRATETLKFIPNEEIKYAYVSVDDADVTLDAGYMQAYVTDSVINGGKDLALQGSEIATLPENYFVKWFYKDEKTDQVTELVSEGNSLHYTIGKVVLDDEFRTYTCEVYRKDGLYKTCIGSYSIKPRIMIMSVSPSPYTTYVKVGDTVPLKLTIDENCYNNWRQGLVVAWQARKDADSDWTELVSKGENNLTYNLKITSEDMIFWEYRAVVGPLIRPIGVQSAPDYHSNSIFFCVRDTKFSGTLMDIRGNNGDDGTISVGIEDGYLSSIDCYWERSQDGGKTWSKVINDNSTFTIVNFTLSTVPDGSGSSVSRIGSTFLTIKLYSSLNGDKFRAVIYDKLSDTYIYTNESLITITGHVHEWSTTQIIPEVPATCTSTGTKAHWHCDSCGKNYADERNEETIMYDVIIPLLGHDFSTTQIIAEDPATCTSTGAKAHWHCNVCNGDFDAENNKLDDVTIPVLEHNFSTTEIIAEDPATCTSIGTKAYWHCNSCGNNYDTDQKTLINDLTISALGHNADGSVAHKDASCTEAGIVGGTYCTRCNDGKTAAETAIPMLEHNFSTTEIIAEDPATCTSTGTKAHWHCDSCGNNYDTDQKPLINDLTISALGHNADGSVAHKDASCTEAGIVGGTYCTRCNDGKTAAETAIPMLEHNFSTTEIIAEDPATCTSIGTKAYWHCNSCGNNYDTDQKTLINDLTISALGHNADGSVAHKDASCTEAGIVGGTYCTRCNDGKTAAETAIPMLEHNFSTTEIIAEDPATCTSIGTKAHWHCNACNGDFDAENNKLDDLTIEASDHDYGDLIEKQNATCTVTGYGAHYECSVCHKLFNAEKVETTQQDLTIAINPNAHSFDIWIDEIPATTETEGIKAHKDCNICGKHFDESGAQMDGLTIPMLPKEDNVSNENEGLSTGAIVGIVAGFTVVAAAVGFFIAWFAVKKKSFGDLAHAIKKIFKK